MAKFVEDIPFWEAFVKKDPNALENFKAKGYRSRVEDSANAEQSKMDQLAQAEEEKRTALGTKQRGQIEEFATGLESRAKDFRGTLAESLSDTGSQFFKRLNPEILEDLNSRGLFTSQTARDQEQGRALADITRENQSSLRRFDEGIFSDVNDIRGSALSAQLGGEQSALDSALALRKASIQRRFDEADAQREQSFAEMLAKRQSRDQLLGSVLGLGGQVGTAAIFCFDPSTKIKMVDRNEKEMADVRLGDRLSDGGLVTSVRQGYTSENTFFNYRGVKVTGYHAVNEDGVWIRVKDSVKSEPLPEEGLVVSLGTTTHRLFINGIEFADEFETDEAGEIGNSFQESLDRLNGKVKVEA